ELVSEERASQLREGDAPIPAPGSVLAPLDKPRFTPAHIVRWMAAQQNWDRIHFDQAFCHESAKLKAPLINGALKQHLIVQFLQRAVPQAWVWRVDYRFVAPDYVGQRLQVRGRAGNSRPAGEQTALDIDVEIFNLDSAEVSTRGRATLLVGTGRVPLDALDA